MIQKLLSDRLYPKICQYSSFDRLAQENYTVATKADRSIRHLANRFVEFFSFAHIYVVDRFVLLLAMLTNVFVRHNQVFSRFDRGFSMLIVLVTIELNKIFAQQENQVELLYDF